MNMQERSNKTMKWKGEKPEVTIKSEIFKYDMIRRLVRPAESSYTTGMESNKICISERV